MAWGDISVLLSLPGPGLGVARRRVGRRTSEEPDDGNESARVPWALRARRGREFEPLGDRVQTRDRAAESRDAWAFIPWCFVAVLAFVLAVILEAEWLGELMEWVSDIIDSIAGRVERQRRDETTMRF